MVLPILLVASDHRLLREGEPSVYSRAVQDPLEPDQMLGPFAVAASS